jgi:hypothetical protein
VLITSLGKYAYGAGEGSVVVLSATMLVGSSERNAVGDVVLDRGGLP